VVVRVVDGGHDVAADQARLIQTGVVPRDASGQRGSRVRRRETARACALTQYRQRYGFVVVVAVDGQFRDGQFVQDHVQGHPLVAHSRTFPVSFGRTVGGCGRCR
jgi:hypothetical protein